MNKICQLQFDNRMRTVQPVNLSKNDTEASLYIYDIIDADWGISALSVIAAIAQAGDAKTLNIHINSPGGSVFESRAMMAAISSFPGKTVAHIDSLCASAATSIATACDEVIMSDGAFYMIHNAMGVAFGDKADMRQTADLLEKIEGAIVNDYTGKTGMGEDEIKKMMDAETWMTAAEAHAMGFVDSIHDAKKKPSNIWNLAAYANAPKALTEPEPISEPSMTQANKNRLRLLEI